jgi:hypothetical protein
MVLDLADMAFISTSDCSLVAVLFESNRYCEVRANRLRAADLAGDLLGTDCEFVFSSVEPAFARFAGGGVGSSSLVAGVVAFALPAFDLNGVRL